MLARGLSRPGRLLILVLVVYGFMWIKGWPRYYDDEELPRSMRPQTGSALGPHRVGHDHLVVSILTTATDVYTKLAPLLAYLFPEDRDPTLLFSDLQMAVGEWPVFDVLFGYTWELMGGNKELARYRQQIDYARKSIPLELAREKSPREEAEVQAKLNKYKILQAMQRAWDYRPDRSWYVFVDDETFVDRVNTLDWLAQYNPKTKWFFGNPTMSGVPDGFATGGSSFILSSGAMKELFKEHNHLIKSWELRISALASALEVVSTVLQAELNLTLTPAWPGISDADPTTVPFSPALWCERVLLMHHVTPDIHSDLFLLLKNRTDNHIDEPLLFADLYDRFMGPEDLHSPRSHWDNLSSHPTNSRWNILFASSDPNDGHAPSGEESPDACAASCNATDSCVQWSFSSVPSRNWNENGDTKCHLSSSLRFGRWSPPLEEGEGDKVEWRSGWRKEVFGEWAKYQRCKNSAH